MRNQKGYFDLGIAMAVAFLILLLGFFASLFFISFEASNQEVSGIVYNTTFDHAISGNTTFSVRAAVDTYVSQENQSTYCLPPNSPYAAIIKKAADDKTVKVVVTTTKYFAIQSPWKCYPNVVVKEIK